MHASPPRTTRAGKTPILVSLALVLAVGIALSILYQPWNALRYGSATPPLPTATDLEKPLTERILERVAAVRAKPYDGAAWGRLGETYDVHELFPEAIASYERAQRLSPEEARWPYLLGVAQRVGDQRAASRSFAKALELDPKLASAHFYAGHGHLQSGRHDEAEQAFRKAAELEPEAPAALIGLAKVALARSQPQEALDLLERAKSLSPTTNEARWLTAAAWRALGDEQKASAFAGPGEVAPAQEPFPDPVRQQLLWNEGVTLRFARQRADTRLARGEREAALQELARYLEKVPQSPKALLAQADLYMKLDQPEEALARYQAALTVDPSDAAGLSQWGIALARTGKRDQATAKLRQASALEPTRIEFQVNLGSLLAGSSEPKERQEGLMILGEAAAARPKDGGLQANLAQALRANGRREEAVAAFERALELAPHDTRLRFEYGVLCAQLGLENPARLEDAVRAFERVVEESPEQVSARVNLVQGLAKLGRHRDALAAMRQAVASAPTHAELRLQLGWMLATSPDDGSRSGTEAVALVEPLATVTKHENPEVLVVLAAAQAEAGDLAKATATVAKALDLLKPKPPETVQDPALVGIIERALACLKAFNEGRAYRVEAP